MTAHIETDICVIGGGSGGLSVAAGASLMGARTVLVERGRMGGDCLNYGCVPSKALLAAGKRAELIRGASAFGLSANVEVDFAAVMDHVADVIASIAPQDSVERFEGLGVRVIQAAARFVGRDEIEAGGVRIKARRFVVATGARPAAPPIPGLSDLDYLTNETLFSNTVLPEHLLVIGAGPIGLEMAQAHRRLGARVTVVEGARAMGRDDPELAAILLRRLAGEGIEVIEGAQVEKAEATPGGKVALTIDGGGRILEGSHLLVAAGRRPNVEGLNLEAAGIDPGRAGISVDKRLRTASPRIFAIGDVIDGGPQFTHAASYQAGIVIRNALFRLPAKADYRALPRVTYTEPELAAVGLGEEEARAAHGKIRLLRWPFAENDRARAEREIAGLVKVVTDRRGRILGAGILGPHAGELLQPWVLAVSKKMKIGDMAGMIAPYPTLSEAGKRAAGSFFTPSLFGERTRRLVRFLARFG